MSSRVLHSELVRPLEKQGETSSSFLGTTSIKSLLTALHSHLCSTYLVNIMLSLESTYRGKIHGYPILSLFTSLVLHQLYLNLYSSFLAPAIMKKLQCNRPQEPDLVYFIISNNSKDTPNSKGIYYICSQL